MANWYAPLPSVSKQQEHDAPYSTLPMTCDALAHQPVDPEELADPFRRRQTDHEHPVGDLDTTQAAAQDRAGDQEQDEPVGRSPSRSPLAQRPPPAPGRPPSDTSTAISVRFGPDPIAQPAPDEAHRDGDHRQRQQDQALFLGESPTASPRPRS